MESGYRQQGERGKTNIKSMYRVMGQTTIVLAVVAGIYAVYCYILVSNLGHIY